MLALISHSTEPVKVQAKSEDRSGRKSIGGKKSRRPKYMSEQYRSGSDGKARKSNAAKKRDWVYLMRSVVV